MQKDFTAEQMSLDVFKGRMLVIATKHKKETVLKPILERALGVCCVTIDILDTDLFGTFSGEVERKLDPYTTAKKKCTEAMVLSGYDLALSSEGSFGSHPIVPFLPVDDELLLLLDKKNDLEISVTELSTHTNYRAAEIISREELDAFASQAQFPAHALILKRGRTDLKDMIKGITDQESLLRHFETLFSQQGKVYVETDMRAMHNPTRMKVIEKAAFKLVEKILNTCPHCQAPGFGVVAAQAGLPCSMCGQETRSALSHLYTCIRTEKNTKILCIAITVIRNRSDTS